MNCDLISFCLISELCILLYFVPKYGENTVISHIMTRLPVHGTQWKSILVLTVSLPGISLFTHSCTVKMAPVTLRNVLCDGAITYIIDYGDPDVKTNIKYMNPKKFRW